MHAEIARLLEPGALFEGALFRDLARAGTIELASGARFGVFKLVREIGRGGMGVVWLAERDDGAYRQQVAIKCIVDPLSADSAELFRRERQILAELRHPGIARLLDGGRRDDGLLWFAMELIDGIAIDRHARARSLPLDARLRLYTTMLDAVGVAHARLVIHRDLKPGNVLVDADGRAKVLDFGIAALADDAAAVRAYSPGWASPEQRAGGSVGTASDQFQLGLLLDAVLRSDDATEPPAVEGEPFDPRRWIAMAHHRARELQAVLARACASAPEARYRSVAELASEIERMLERRPISAMRRRTFYPVACAVRRRPGVFAASAAVLLLATSMVAAFAARLTQERDTSRVQAERAEAQAALARQEAATTQAINRFLNEDLLTAADPYGENLKDTPMGVVIERAVPRVAARLGGQPAVAGEVYRTLGKMLSNLGRTEAARGTLDLAVAALSAAHGPTSRSTVDTRILRAEVEINAGRYDENEGLLRALRADLTAVDVRDPRVVEVDLNLAWSAFVLGRFDEAERGYGELIERTAGRAEVTDLDRASMYGGRSVALARLNRAAEALEDASRGHAIRERLLGPDHPDTLQSAMHVAAALLAQDRLAEAVAAYRDLHDRALARFGARHTETLLLAHELGTALMRSARAEEAIPYLEQVVAEKSAAQGDLSGSTMNSIAWLGLAYVRTGRLHDADAAFARVAAFQSTADFERRAEIGLRRNIGELRLAQGRAADALASCDAAARIASGMLDPAHALRASTEACRGIAMIDLGRGSDGRELLRGVRESLHRAGSQTMVWTAKADAMLAE